VLLRFERFDGRPLCPNTVGQRSPLLQLGQGRKSLIRIGIGTVEANEACCRERGIIFLARSLGFWRGHKAHYVLPQRSQRFHYLLAVERLSPIRRSE